MIKSTSSAYKWWLLALMMVSTAMAILDTTIINSVIPALSKDFSENLSHIEWIVTGYLLSMCIMLPTAGWFASKWGYKRIYLIGMILFTLGSYMCYLSSSLSMLIFSRVVEGIGSGVVQSLGLAIIIRHFDARNRALALGLWGIASAAAVSMGPYLGGELLLLYGWNSLFAINVPVGVLNILVAALVMNEVKDSGIGKFNLWGFLLTGLPAPLLVVGLALGVSLGWSSIIVLSTLSGAILSGIGFVLYNKSSKEPFIDFSIFHNRNFALSVIALGGLGFGFYGGNYLFPLYMEHSLSYTAIMVGGFYLPVGLLQGVLAPISGVLARRTGEWILVVVGLSLFCIYLLMSAWYGLETSFGYIVVSVLLRGFGLGLSFTSLNALAVKTLSHEQMTSASGINNTIKQVSGSLGIAIFTALITSSLHPEKLSLVTPKEHYVEAVDSSFYIALFFALFGLLAVLFMRRVVR
ncbi:MAG: DHA2 family efflux MFS transporter permease subunit [Rikenellaceae bacterium]